MNTKKNYGANTHVVDILGSVRGRDQTIMLVNRAVDFVSLLAKKTIVSDDIVFFDPFCKAGEILLASALLRNSYGKKALMDVEKIKKDMFKSNTYYALAPDERHYRLSLRTFLGNDKSHEKEYQKIIYNGNYLSEIDGCLNVEKYKTEILDMIEYIKKDAPGKKIIAIGNPPYQESDGGFGKSAKTIYHLLTDALIENEDISQVLVVIPSRWFGGGKGVDGFRKKMMNSKKIKTIRYFKNAEEVFPTVDINGGVCFLHYDKKNKGKTSFSDGTYKEAISLNEFEVMTDDPRGYAIVRKIMEKWKGDYVSSSAWPRKAFGLSTNYFLNNNSLKPTSRRAVPCLSRGKEINYADINHIIREEEINAWKVSVPKAAGGSKGNRRSTIPLNQIFLVDKGVITTETYNIVDSFKTKKEAENLINYLKTDFARYLLGLRKITQDLPANRWGWVPYVDLKNNWTDAKLFKYFNLTGVEIKHIAAKVLEWSC